MKRVLSIVLALTLLVALAVPAFAAEFVGSIEAKPTPSFNAGTLKDKDGNPVELSGSAHALSLEDAMKSDTEEAKQLVKAYTEIKDGTAKLPGENLVVTHVMEFNPGEVVMDVLKDGGSIDITFDIGVKAGVTVAVMTYVDGKWENVKAVKNNGDGTVTATFTHFCPIAFATTSAPAKTGDAAGNSMILWTSVLVLSAAAVVALVVIRRKNTAK